MSIKFGEVLKATLIKRPSEKIKSPYVADIRLEDGTISLAHAPSLGLGGILKPGSELMVTKSKNPKAKTSCVIEAVKEGQTWVGNVPLNANRLIGEVLREEYGEDDVKAEVKHGDSRFDFKILSKDIYVEVKSAHIKRGESALFPVGYKKPKAVTVSERANKHVKHITEIKGMLIFVVQRDDCKNFRPNREDDEIFSNLIKKANEAGVEIRAYEAKVDIEGIKIIKKMNILYV